MRKVSLKKESLVGRLGTLGLGIAPEIYEMRMMRMVRWTGNLVFAKNASLVYTMHHI